MTEVQILAIKCAYADLLGALQNYEQGTFSDHDWDAHKLTLDEMVMAFPEILDEREFITYTFLREHGTFLDSALEGTCRLYRYKNNEYVVLCDNTVITRDEDNSIGDAIFPYLSE
jgi:hypothetical protein